MIQMRTAIVTDSTCDLPREIYDRYPITVLPLHITRGDESLLDGAEITAEDVFAHEAATGALCSTAAVNVSEFAACFRELSREYGAVICVTISAEFSTCYQNACLAAEECSLPVYVVDSKNLSGGQGLLALEGAKLAERGLSPHQIAAFLEGARERLDSSFVLDRLDYMRKGGRCSSVTALGANLLNLKPCIEVREGEMRVGRKYRGDLARVMDQYIKGRLAPYGPGETGDAVVLAHPPGEERYLAAARRALREDGRFSAILEAPSGCTVACHCGPNTVGVMFLHQKERA